jgi:hypothetical protein
VVYFCGKLTDEQYAGETAAFRAFLTAEAAKAGKEHVRAFLDKWPEPKAADRPMTQPA